MSKLGDALRRKYKTPQEAARVLGVDAALLASDSQIQEIDMTVLSRAAIMVRAAAIGKYAMDSSTILSLDKIVEPLTAKNWATSKAGVALAIKGLAKDAKLEDVTGMLDHLEKAGAAADEPNSGMPEACTIDWEAEAEDARKRLGRDETPEEEEEREKKMSAKDARKRYGRDESEEEKKKREGEDKKARDARRGARDAKRAKDAEKGMTKEEVEKTVKSASDAAADAAVKKERANQTAIRAALEKVRPVTGTLHGAFDSAADVYGAALEARGVKIEGIPAVGFEAMFNAMPAPGVLPLSNDNRDTLAMDQDSQTSLEKMFPGAAAIGLNGVAVRE